MLNFHACPYFYNQELKVHLHYFTFETVMLKKEQQQKIKASKLHLLGQAPLPPSQKITHPNITCLCGFPQKANCMWHSQCPWISAASKQLAPPTCCLPGFGSLPAPKGRGQEMSCCYSPFIQEMERLSGCQPVSANKTPLQTLADESQCENFLHMNCFARSA